MMASLTVVSMGLSGGSSTLESRFNAKERIDDIITSIGSDENADSNGSNGSSSSGSCNSESCNSGSCSSGSSSSGSSSSASSSSVASGGNSGDGENNSTGSNDANSNGSSSSDDNSGGSTESRKQSVGTGVPRLAAGGDSFSNNIKLPRQPPVLRSDDSTSRINFLQSKFLAYKAKQQLPPNHPFPPTIPTTRPPFAPARIGAGISAISPPSIPVPPPKFGRTSVPFPPKNGHTPVANYPPLDPAITQAALAAFYAASNTNTAGATGGGDAPYLGGAAGAQSTERTVATSIDMHPLDQCLSEIICSLSAVGQNGIVADGDKSTSVISALAEHLRHHKLSEQRQAERQIVERFIMERQQHEPFSIVTPAGYSMEEKLKIGLHSRIESPPPSPQYVALYSRKVFVGGLPPDIIKDDIIACFRHFGPLDVDWPHNVDSKSYYPPKGYAFLLFQYENSVQQLVASCFTDDGKMYFCVSSLTIKDKPAQIRPWLLSDADYVLDPTMSLDPRKTVFVGGVPRPVKAAELAMVMDRLYGSVYYAGIDTDPVMKYPKGAGRVAFSSQQSYIAAISARFVQLEAGDIDKRIEVKPYVLDDQMCDECAGKHCGNKFAPFFCANVMCLRYFCEHCWAAIHSRQGREYHKPLVKDGTNRPRTVPFHWC